MHIDVTTDNLYSLDLSEDLVVTIEAALIAGHEVSIWKPEVVVTIRMVVKASV